MKITNGSNIPTATEATIETTQETTIETTFSSSQPSYSYPFYTNPFSRSNITTGYSYYLFYNQSNGSSLTATIRPNKNIDVSALLVGGGGGGGGTSTTSASGGGGGGGVIYGTFTMLAGNTYTINVGRGGTAGFAGGNSSIYNGTTNIVTATGGSPGTNTMGGAAGNTNNAILFNVSGNSGTLSAGGNPTNTKGGLCYPNTNNRNSYLNFNDGETSVIYFSGGGGGSPDPFSNIYQPIRSGSGGGNLTGGNGSNLVGFSSGGGGGGASNNLSTIFTSGTNGYDANDVQGGNGGLGGVGGGGGGGGGSSIYNLYSANGGNGGNGVVMIYFNPSSIYPSINPSINPSFNPYSYTSNILDVAGNVNINGNLNTDGFINGVINNPNFIFLPLDISNNFAKTWTNSSDPSGNWKSVAVSSSGQYQVAVCPINCIYVSNNYGVTWIQTNNIQNTWNNVSISASGQYIVATISNSNIIYYSNNYGSTNSWKTRYFISSANGIPTIAMSASGQYRTIVTSGTMGPDVSGNMYYSTNYGISWIQVTNSLGQWQSVAVSSSGQYQVAVCPINGIYVSTNYGVTWSQTNNIQNTWNNVVISASGQYIVVTISNSNIIYYSNNYGSSNSWNTLSFISTANGIPTIAMSASGQYRTIVTSGTIGPGVSGNMYYSTNYGVTWNQVTNSTGSWSSVAVSASGQYQTSVVNGGNIYRSVIPITNLTVDGSVTAGSVTAGSFNATSDYRIKENVTLLEDSFILDDLKPVTYLNKKTGNTDIGLIAHELQEVYPFLVTGEKDGSEMQTINYIGLIGILIKEIQDLKKEMSTLSTFKKGL